MPQAVPPPETHWNIARASGRYAHLAVKQNRLRRQPTIFVGRLENTKHRRSSPALPFFTLLLVVALPANPQVAASFAQLNGALVDPAGAAIVEPPSHCAKPRPIAFMQPGPAPAAAMVGGPATGLLRVVSGGPRIRHIHPIRNLSERRPDCHRRCDLTDLFARGKIVVSEEAPAIEPGRTEISQVVDTRQIGALPAAAGSSPISSSSRPGLPRAAPVCNPRSQNLMDQGLVWRHARSKATTVTWTAPMTSIPLSGSQRAIPSQEAVSEFRVINNSFGRTTAWAPWRFHQRVDQIRHQQPAWFSL